MNRYGSTSQSNPRWTGSQTSEGKIISISSQPEYSTMSHEEIAYKAWGNQNQGQNGSGMPTVSLNSPQPNTYKQPLSRQLDFNAPGFGQPSLSMENQSSFNSNLGFGPMVTPQKTSSMSMFGIAPQNTPEPQGNNPMSFAPSNFSMQQNQPQPSFGGGESTFMFGEQNGSSVSNTSSTLFGSSQNTQIFTSGPTSTGFGLFDSGGSNTTIQSQGFGGSNLVSTQSNSFGGQGSFSDQFGGNSFSSGSQSFGSQQPMQQQQSFGFGGPTQQNVNTNGFGPQTNGIPNFSNPTPTTNTFGNVSSISAQSNTFGGSDFKFDSNSQNIQPSFGVNSTSTSSTGSDFQFTSSQQGNHLSTGNDMFGKAPPSTHQHQVSNQQNKPIQGEFGDVPFVFGNGAPQQQQPQQPTNGSAPQFGGLKFGDSKPNQSTASGFGGQSSINLSNTTQIPSFTAPTTGTSDFVFNPVSTTNATVGSNPIAPLVNTTNFNMNAPSMGPSVTNQVTQGQQQQQQQMTSDNSMQNLPNRQELIKNPYSYTLEQFITRGDSQYDLKSTNSFVPTKSNTILKTLPKETKPLGSNERKVQIEINLENLKKKPVVQNVASQVVKQVKSPFKPRNLSVEVSTVALPKPIRNRLPKLTKTGYYTQPSIPEMESMDLKKIKNLIIGRQGFGEILFMGETDVTGLNFDDIVTIERGSVTVYPKEDMKPIFGCGLNKTSRIKLMGVFPKTSSGMNSFVDRLKRSLVKSNGEFVQYKPENGEWIFDILKE